MSVRLLGWIPTLFLVPVAGAALGVGSWKGGVLFIILAFVSAPIQWKRGILGHLQRHRAEKAIFCFMLVAVGTIMTGVDTTPDEDAMARARGKSSLEIMPLFAGRFGMANSDASGSANGSSGEGGNDNGRSSKGGGAAERKRAHQRRRMAVREASGCNKAHKVAEGAIRRIVSGDVPPDVRETASAAVAACEDSWVLFGGKDIDERERRDPDASEKLLSCGEGYMGRWLVNEDLLNAVDQGLPAKEVGRIVAMNQNADKSVSTCSAFLRKTWRDTDDKGRKARG